mmetsp:Transcript_1876/g.2810  ORF Transcript_1876/g.2810 Transcript_1876/m.2810 type:complete len:82 (+) Transcript_1876:148-393(+)
MRFIGPIATQCRGMSAMEMDMDLRACMHHTLSAVHKYYCTCALQTSMSVLLSFLEAGSYRTEFDPFIPHAFHITALGSAAC